MRGLVVVALVAVTSTARADDPPDDRIGLVVQGTAGLRGRLEDHLETQLRREGFSAVDTPMSRDALNTLANCFIIEDLACARGVVEARAKTPRVLFARVEESGTTVSIDLTWFSAGSAPLADRATCESCTDTFAKAADAPLRHLAQTAPKPVVPEPEPEPPTQAPPSRFWPITMMAAGTVTLATGAVCLYYGLRDDESHKYIYPQLTPVGIAMLAVGAGTAIGGFILMPAGRPRSQPVAAVSRGGAYLGWLREF
jgi:hypothetical protein